MTTIKDLDQNIVTRIAKKNETAEALFTRLAVTERNRSETNIYRLRQELVNQGFKVVPQEFVAALRDLQQIGAGTLVQEKGKAAKFRWNFRMSDIGKMGLEPSINAPEPPSKAQLLIDRIVSLKDRLEALKPMYGELDNLTLELKGISDAGAVHKASDGRFVALIDNFAEKNTAYKATGVKRFDIDVMTKEELAKYESKVKKVSR